MATDTPPLWSNVVTAGGRDGWIKQQLRDSGLLVERRDADSLSEVERGRYKQQLKDEAAERRRLRRLVWQSYRAAHIVHLGEGVYWNDADDLDVYDQPDAEERAAQNGLPALNSPDDLAAALGVSVAALRWLAWHRDAASILHYRRFEIPKRDGTRRAIWAPLPRIKAAQRWILREIVERLPVHGAVHGFLVGRSVKSNAARHTGSAIVVQLDIRDFFPTVTLRRVKGLFRKAGYREQVATLLALICTEAPREVVQDQGKTLYIALGPRCLPQGAPTSPGITNALGLRLDRRLSGLARALGWRYTRYADDLTFSLPRTHKGAHRLSTLLGGARRIVEAEGFQLHPKKTHVARAGGRQEVTGLVVNGTGPPRVPREDRRRLRAALHNLSHGGSLREGESLESLAGLAAWIHVSNPEEGRRYLDAIAALKG